MKGNLLAIIGIFMVSWLICFVGNYVILKSSTPPVEETENPIQEESSTPTDVLNLTWNLSKPPGQVTEQPTLIATLGADSIREKVAKPSQEKDVISIVDSLISEETDPLKEEVAKLKQDLNDAKEQVDQLENLLALVSGEQDSLDQAQAKRLSKMLEGMKPKAAAIILTRLNSKTNAKLLMLMRQKSAAKILAELPEDRAAAIAKYLSKGYAESSI